MKKFTLVMTKGTHVVDDANAEKLLCAIRNNDPLVEVEIDLMCDGIDVHQATIVVAHVVAIVDSAPEEPHQFFGASLSNVTPLRRGS